MAILSNIACIAEMLHFFYTELFSLVYAILVVANSFKTNCTHLLKKNVLFDAGRECVYPLKKSEIKKSNSHSKSEYFSNTLISIE